MDGTVKLNENLERSIDALVGTGRYASREEVVRDGMRLVSERESRLREFDESVASSLADVRAGRVTPADKVFEELRHYYRKMLNDRG